MDSINMDEWSNESDSGSESLPSEKKMKHESLSDVDWLEIGETVITSQDDGTTEPLASRNSMAGSSNGNNSKAMVPTYNRYRRSSIWDHFIKMVGGAKCRYCLRIFSCTRGLTSNLIRHLRLLHKTIPFTSQRYLSNAALINKIVTDTLNRTANPSDVESQQSSEISPKAPGQAANDIENDIIEASNSEMKNLLDKALLDFACQECVSFDIVDNDNFKLFVRMLNPNYELPSRKNMSNSLLPEAYKEHMKKVKRNITLANCLAITCDGWANVRNTHYLALSAHFIDENFKFMAYLLECTEIEKLYDGKDITAWMKEILQRYHIQDKVEAIIIDSATNMKEIVSELHLKHTPCFADTLNNIAENAINNSIKKTVDEVRKVVAYFKKHQYASQALTEIQKKLNLEPLKLKQDVSSRWNSTYEMLDKFSKNKMALLACMDTLAIETSLQIQDWILMEQSLSILMLFNAASDIVSNENHVTISHAGLLSCVLLQKTTATFSSNSKFHPDAQNLLTFLVQGINKRFAVFRNSEIVTKAMLLDPRIKKAGFQNNSQQYEKTYDLIVQDLIPLFTARTEDMPVSPQRTKDLDLFYRGVFGLSSEQQIDTAKDMAVCELNMYLHSTTIEIDQDPLEWWKQHNAKYPSVFSLAKKFMCIPGTCVPCKRMFSKAGQVHNEKRSKLVSKKLNDILFVRHNS